VPVLLCACWEAGKNDTNAVTAKAANKIETMAWRIIGFLSLANLGEKLDE